MCVCVSITVIKERPTGGRGDTVVSGLLGTAIFGSFRRRKKAADFRVLEAKLLQLPYPTLSKPFRKQEGLA